jgi:hypothetical protein
VTRAGSSGFSAEKPGRAVEVLEAARASVVCIRAFVTWRPEHRRKVLDIEATLGIGQQWREGAREEVGSSPSSPSEGRGHWHFQLYSIASNSPSYASETAQCGNLTETLAATSLSEPTNLIVISRERSAWSTEVLIDFNDPQTKGEVLGRSGKTDLEAQATAVGTYTHAAGAMMAKAEATLGEVGATFTHVVMPNVFGAVDG